MRPTLYTAALIALMLAAVAFSDPATKPATEFRGAIPNMMVKDLAAATTPSTSGIICGPTAAQTLQSDAATRLFKQER